MRTPPNSNVAVCANECVADAGRFHTLLPALKWLDDRLEQAVAAARLAIGPAAGSDPFRGLYLQQQEIEQLVVRPIGESQFFLHEERADDAWPRGDAAASALIRLAAEFSLTAIDLRILVIALAPELDLRYERIYAYLQDDVSRKRPTVDLALHLLGGSPAQRLNRWSHLAPDAPLIRNGLLSLVPDPQQAQPPKLACVLKIDDQVVQWLLGIEGLDPRLQPFCSWLPPTARFDELPLPHETKATLNALVRQAYNAQRPLLLYFQRLRGAGQRDAAAAVAAAGNRSLLLVDLHRALSRASDFENALPVLFRTARWQGAILCFENFDVLASDQQPGTCGRLLDALRRQSGICILCGSPPWGSFPGGLSGVHSVSFGMPSFAERLAAWRGSLHDCGMIPSEEELESLAGLYRLTSEQIADAVTLACDRAAWQSASQPPSSAPRRPDFKELCGAARAQATVVATGLVRKIEPRAEWDDLVLPPDPLAQLRELCDHAKYRHVVYGDWGFDRKVSRGTGLVALFAGPPGTGKTMAAEVIANELGLELFRIELSQVINKYIGETEKNLERVFATAERANGILLFDEADAVFGQRSQVRDAHDRYANIEVGYLLQKMEEYDGVAILATNLAANMDDAFVRRLTFRVEFPFPDATHRRRIWRQAFPHAAPLDAGLDYDDLAGRFKIAGGNIKNIVLSASFLAAAEQRSISMRHVLQAVRREFQKMGKSMTAADLGEHFAPNGPAAK